MNMDGMIGEVLIFHGDFAPTAIPAATQKGHQEWIPIVGLLHGASR